MSEVPSADRHHLWWVRGDYKGKYSKFRGLHCQIVLTDGAIHQALHYQFEPPKKPNRDAMREALRRHSHRQCCCFDQVGQFRQSRLVEALWVPDYAAAELPACFMVRIDAFALELRRQYHRRPRQLSPDDLAVLLERHGRDLCSCRHSARRRRLVPAA